MTTHPRTTAPSFIVTLSRTAAIVALSSACTLVSTKVVQVDKKSTLEEQFIGEYEELTDDLATMSSVRAAAGQLGPTGNDPYQRALQARRVQRFYQDDLARARVRGCLGEALDGRVVVLPCAQQPASMQAASSLPVTEPAVERLAKLENTAREALVDYALSRAENLREADRASVWQAFRRVVIGALAPGSLVQTSGGQWSPVSGK